MTNEQPKTLREQLVQAMQGGNSHLPFDKIVADFPRDLVAAKPHGVAHSGWELLEHLRITQHDILEFARNPEYRSPQWPEGYWPASAEPPNHSAWDETIAAFRRDAAKLKRLMEDPNSDLFAAIAGGDGQTLLREALLVATHNSYHLGQLEFLKKMLLAGL